MNDVIYVLELAQMGGVLLLCLMLSKHRLIYKKIYI
jgi:hypothetical protein